MIIWKLPGHTRFDDYRYDLNYLKQYYTEWMEGYGSGCWMSLFFENHDNPRMISKINEDPEYRFAIGKLLGMIQFTLRGTPFIYQGQELGAINGSFTDISQIQDVESRNLYEEFCRTMGEEEALAPDPCRNPRSCQAYDGLAGGMPSEKRQRIHLLFL